MSYPKLIYQLRWRSHPRSPSNGLPAMECPLLLTLSYTFTLLYFTGSYLQAFKMSGLSHLDKIFPNSNPSSLQQKVSQSLFKHAPPCFLSFASQSTTLWLQSLLLISLNRVTKDFHVTESNGYFLVLFKLTSI